LEHLREIWHVLRFDLRQTVRSFMAPVFGSIFLLLAGAGALAGISAVKKIEEEILASFQGSRDTLGKEQLAELLATGYRQILERFISDPEAIRYYESFSPAALFVLLGSAWIVPYLVLFLSQDTLSSELYGRRARFLLLRARRHSVVIGKILGRAALASALVGLTLALIFGVIVAVVPAVPLAGTALIMAQSWVALTLVSLCYTAFATLLSSLCDTPTQSFVFSLLSLIVFGFLRALSWVFDSLDPWLPGSYVSDILSAMPSDRWTGASGLLVFTAVFTAAALAVFQRRSV